MQIYTKKSLIEKLQEIRQKGWILNTRPGNDGGIGNTLEDLLGIKENNLPIPNAAEWELKTQRLNTTSLVTLFHLEPSPRALRIVSNILLPKYGWRHKEAGRKYPIGEMSFRQTISGDRRSDRGFKVVVDRNAKKVLISFDASAVDPRHKQWLQSVKQRAGLGELDPQPYWGFNDLKHKAGTKLLNCFLVLAECRRDEKGQLWFRYSKIYILESFSLDGLLKGLEEGFVFIDFDARTGHNHGTKFRLRRNMLPCLYQKVTEI
ncbi:MvaI/BcnI family restriction endonuclease [Rhodothermus profundi]|uniref:MvaI/BcnI restriction endonuclease family protein n=1 Tax=Rhodothermus profundi TaxID=633813 RepID=A0A1M6RLF4_9BACT|nr:MvaI/BcnI family restriction endonuclease [Rhodothermus profundi]SHK33188.1 MvaI/BcnI restriction endonuclease family protein [Rhodothermus profundi]